MTYQMKQITSPTRPAKGLIFLFGMMILLSSCGEKQQNNEVLQQAFELHKEAIKIQKMTLDQLAQLKANTDSLFVETYTEDLNAISSSLEAWEGQLVEVPGFEEEHDHAHHDHSGHDHAHHDHHHGEQQELTPKQHLEVQQQLLDDIKAIAEKVDTIKG